MTTRIMEQALRARAVAVGVSLGAACVSMSGCTADPVGMNLRSAMPRAAFHRGARQSSDQSPNVSSAQRVLSRAVRLGEQGDYDRAIALLRHAPAFTDPATRRGRRDVFRRLSYLRQRRWFAGMGVVAVAGAVVRGSVSTTSLSAAQGDHLRTDTYSFDTGLVAYGISLEQRQDVRAYGSGRRRYLPRGIALTVQAYGGRADIWPNTKLTGGVRMTSDDSRACPCRPGGSLDLFAGGAHRFGPIATGLMLGAMQSPSRRPNGTCAYSDAWGRLRINWLSLGSILPFAEVSQSLWESRSGSFTVTGSVASGMRVLFGRSDAMGIEALARQRYGRMGGVRVRGSGAELRIIGWFF